MLRRNACCSMNISCVYIPEQLVVIASVIYNCQVKVDLQRYEGQLLYACGFNDRNHCVETLGCIDTLVAKIALGNL